MAERISEKKALQRYNEYAEGYCECCGKKLTRYKRGKKWGKGSWEAIMHFQTDP